MPKCEHMNFIANVEVNRLTKSEEDPSIIGYTADVRIRCADCSLPFEFIGVDAGYSPRMPMASVDAQELRAPIRPKGSNILPAIPGFNVKAH